MFYYLYKITNLVNNKIYVGVHKTKNLNDGYMGSGKIICSAIKKHGIVNFEKTILKTFDTSEEMYASEKELVTEEFLKREDVYNLRRGGSGGFDYINKSGIVKFKGKRHKEANKPRMGHPGNNFFKGKTHTEETKLRIANNLKGRKRSPESIAKQKEIWRLKKLQSGCGVNG